MNLEENIIFIGNDDKDRKEYDFNEGFIFASGKENFIIGTKNETIKDNSTRINKVINYLVKENAGINEDAIKDENSLFLISFASDVSEKKEKYKSMGYTVYSPNNNKLENTIKIFDAKTIVIDYNRADPNVKFYLGVLYYQIHIKGQSKEIILDPIPMYYDYNNYVDKKLNLMLDNTRKVNQKEFN